MYPRAEPAPSSRCSLRLDQARSAGDYVPLRPVLTLRDAVIAIGSITRLPASHFRAALTRDQLQTLSQALEVTLRSFLPPLSPTLPEASQLSR